MIFVYKKTYLSLAILFAFFSVKAQTAMYQWGDHLSYSSALHVEIGTDFLYAATEHGILTYGFSSHELHTFSKINGLSDTDISDIEFDEARNQLIVAYSNGKIDFLKDNNIRLMSDIERATIQNSKIIHHIFIHENLAYLSTGFGVVVIDLDKSEVKSTYKISETGSEIQVFATSIWNNNIYAATEEGLKYASLDEPNLQDYNVWHTTAVAGMKNELSDLVLLHDRLVVFDKTALKVYASGVENLDSWSEISGNFDDETSLVSNQDKLAVISSGKLSFYDNQLNVVSTISNYEGSENVNIQDVDWNDNLTVFADEIYAAVSTNDFVHFQKYIPNKPFSNHVFRMQAANNIVWAVGGAYNLTLSNIWHFGELYKYENGQWTSIILWDKPHRDFVSLAVDPANPQHVIAGSWGWGVADFSGNTLQETTSLEDLSNNIQDDANAGFAGAMTFDENQTLWITNSFSNSQILAREKDGNWHQFYYPELSSTILRSEIVVTPRNHKWVIIPNANYLFVFDDNQTLDNMDDDLAKRVNVSDEFGNSIANNVLDMKLDRNDVLWLGTDKGVVTFYRPEDAFENEIYAERVKIQSDSGDSIVEYLLSSNQVNAVAIDGGNRKWFGTDMSGVYLMSENCDKQLLHFTTENSPLISNKIVDIEIEPYSGEVFFATDKGLVSYQSDASEPRVTAEEVYVFPNPVRPEYDGPITIRGLQDDMLVKITDIQGNLVVELDAEGGQAVWDGKRVDGSDVVSGLYLFFCGNRDGSETCTSKVLIVR